jgi:hypothetical protein
MAKKIVFAWLFAKCIFWYLANLLFSQVYFLALGNVFASNREKVKSHFEAVNYFKFKTFNYKVV